MKTKLLCFSLFLAMNAEAKLPADPIAKTEAFFTGLSAESMNLVGEFYAPNAHFEDPLGKHKGVAEIRAYYENLYQNVESIRFLYTNRILSGDQLVLFWTMELKAPKLSDELIVVDGNSVFRFDSTGKAAYHRDYFDMGAFVYEQIPVLKNLIRYIKKRMKQ